MIRVDSARWTGRSHYAPTPVDRLLDRIRWSVLYPDFDCADCIGMREHGCQCAHYECVAPCTPPEWWRVALRSLLTSAR